VLRFCSKLVAEMIFMSKIAIKKAKTLQLGTSTAKKLGSWYVKFSSMSVGEFS
jgi:hypothetical protein